MIKKSIRETWCRECTKARGKCTKNTSLSLRTRKLDVKFFSRSRSYKETCWIQKFTGCRETWSWEQSHFGVHSWMSHSKLQFILVEIIGKIYDFTKNQLLKSVEELFPGDWEVDQGSKRHFQVLSQLITNSLRGDVTKLLRSRVPKTYVLRRLGAMLGRH